MCLNRYSWFHPSLLKRGVCVHGFFIELGRDELVDVSSNVQIHYRFVRVWGTIPAMYYIKSLCALVLLLSTSPAWSGPFDDGVVLTMAHRGTSDLSDENTLEAMSVAYEYGAHIIEVDPRLTADGVYVLMHDRTIDRTTNGRGKISEMTYAEVTKLKTQSGYSIPTLKQTLEFARQRNLLVYIDIKEAIRMCNPRLEIESLQISKVVDYCVSCVA